MIDPFNHDLEAEEKNVTEQDLDDLLEDREFLIKLASRLSPLVASGGSGGGGGSVEGTAVLSTGEAGGTKFLREDGDGTSSWQTVPSGSGDLVSTNNLSDVANAATSLSNLGGIGAATTDTLTNKTVNLTSNTLTGTKAQFDTAVSDGTIAYDGGAHHDGFSDFAANEHIDWTSTSSNFNTSGNLQADGTITLGAGSLIYPSADGSDGQAIVTDGAGNLSFSGTVAASVDALVLDMRKGSVGTITKGTPIYLSQWNPSGYAEVEQADADDAAKMPAITIADQDITNAATVSVIVFGNMTGMDTSSFSVGDGLYVSDAGALTATRPANADDGVQRIGTVIRSHASLGVIQITGAGRSNDIPNRMSDATFRISDDGDATKLINFQASGITTGTTRTITMPDANVDLGHVNDLPVANLANGTDGELITWDAAGAPATVGVGTANQVLTSNGAGAAPTFQDAAAGGGIPDVTIAASGGDATTLGGATINNGDFVYIADSTTEAGAVTITATNVTIMAAKEAIVDMSTYKLDFSGEGLRVLSFNFTCTKGELDFGSAEAQVSNVRFTTTSNGDMFFYGQRSIYQNITINDTTASGSTPLTVGHKVLVDGVHFDDNTKVGSTGNGTMYIIGSNTIVNNVWINAESNTSGDAIFIKNNGSWNVISNVHGETDAGATISWIEGGSGTRNTYSNCTFEEGKYGFNITAGGRETITGCTFEGQSSAAIYLANVNASNVNISGCVFDGTVKGVDVESADYANITGNMFMNLTTGVSINSSNSDKCMVVGNNFGNAVTTPISDSGKGTIIRDNIGVDPTMEKQHMIVTNDSGGALAAGDVVVMAAAADGKGVTTTTTAGDPKVMGMAIETINAAADGQILTIGKTTALKVDGTDDIAIGDLLSTFTSAGIAQKAAAGETAFAIALEAYTTDDSLGVIDALLITPRDA